MKFFVTFGQGQYGGLLADKYLEVEAPSLTDVTHVMKHVIDLRWSQAYSPEEFMGQVENYNLRRLAHIDVHGNILERG